MDNLCIIYAQSMDNLWVIYGQSMDNIWEKCPICPSAHYARQVSEMLPTAVDASADSSEIWAARIVTADLLTIPRHLRWSKNTGEGRFATWRETTIRYVEWWCLCICIYRINYIYIYICIVWYPLGKIWDVLRPGFLGRLLRNFARLQDGPIVDHGILTRLGHIKIQSLRFWQKVPSSESCGFIFRW